MRVIGIVLDSVGIGWLPDAVRYGDGGADTLNHVIKYAKYPVKLENMRRLGIGNIEGVWALDAVAHPKGSFARLLELSAGKDTTTGHWELMGLKLDRPFPTYPDGFPPEIIDEFKKRIGRDILGNKPASGTEIIKELGEEHIRTGYPIVYTSADSVFQIAAHEEVVPLEELYKWCEIAREILQGDHAVARVIARPFRGDNPSNFWRTPNRRDFSLPPTGPVAMDYMEGKVRRVAVGKIWDIYAHKGFDEHYKTKSNAHGMEVLIDLVKHRKEDNEFIFVNLVDFDMKYGHRNNVEGYAKALEEFDRYLGQLLDLLGEDDVLFLTADHGCDPTFPGTDHTRESVFWLVYGISVRQGVDLGVLPSFGVVGATVLQIFGLEGELCAEGVWDLIREV